MKVDKINSQTFGWRYNQQITRYGNSTMKATEYYRDNGLKLLVVDSFNKGVQTLKTKELYDKSWKLIKRKIIQYTNGRMDKPIYF